MWRFAALFVLFAILWHFMIDRKYLQHNLRHLLFQFIVFIFICLLKYASHKTASSVYCPLSAAHITAWFSVHENITDIESVCGLKREQLCARTAKKLLDDRCRCRCLFLSNSSSAHNELFKSNKSHLVSSQQKVQPIIHLSHLTWQEVKISCYSDDHSVSAWWITG